MKPLRYFRLIRWDSLGVISLSALLLGSGCFRWVPIEPNFAGGQTQNLSKVRVGGEGGEVIADTKLSWPMMVAVKDGQAVTIDLRATPVARRELTRGGVAAIVVPSVIGSLAVTTLLLMVWVVGAASIAGG